MTDNLSVSYWFHLGRNSSWSQIETKLFDKLHHKTHRQFKSWPTP